LAIKQHQSGIITAVPVADQTELLLNHYRRLSHKCGYVLIPFLFLFSAISDESSLINVYFYLAPLLWIISLRIYFLENTGGSDFADIK
jgi:hypothetical protein